MEKEDVVGLVLVSGMIGAILGLALAPKVEAVPEREYEVVC